MKLYQINQSAYSHAVERDWTETLKNGDAVILIESGVLRCIQDSEKLNALIAQDIKIFLRQQDLKGYGLTSNIGHAITDAEWVSLTSQYSKIVSW